MARAGGTRCQQPRLSRELSASSGPSPLQVATLLSPASSLDVHADRTPQTRTSLILDASRLAFSLPAALSAAVHARLGAMRIPLKPSRSFKSQLPLASPSPSDPPLVFIDREPFLVEFQGKLELPEGEADESGGSDEASRLRGSRVGKIDLSDPKKPTMRIAHHRLEGKLETLLTPYALLRTSRRRRRPTSTTIERDPAAAQDDGDGEEEDATETDSDRTQKRRRVAGDGTSLAILDSERPQAKRGENEGDDDEEEEEGGASSTEIEIVAIIRKKIVFNKRPEPLIEVSSEADPIAANSDARKDRDAKRGPKSLLGFGGGKR